MACRVIVGNFKALEIGFTDRIMWSKLSEADHTSPVRLKKSSAGMELNHACARWLESFKAMVSSSLVLISVIGYLILWKVGMLNITIPSENSFLDFQD